MITIEQIKSSQQRLLEIVDLRSDDALTDSSMAGMLFLLMTAAVGIAERLEKLIELQRPENR